MWGTSLLLSLLFEWADSLIRSLEVTQLESSEKLRKLSGPGQCLLGEGIIECSCSLGPVMGWIASPPQPPSSYVAILTTRTSECDLVWR